MMELQYIADELDSITPKEHIHSENLTFLEINKLVSYTKKKIGKMIKRFKSEYCLALKNTDRCKQALHFCRSNKRTSSHRKAAKSNVNNTKSSDSDGPGDRKSHSPFQFLYNLIFILFPIFQLQPILFSMTSTEEMDK